MGAVFGLSSYVASLSVAMWKDPVFSASVVLSSTLLYEFVLAGGHPKRPALHCALYILATLLTLFWRNNGFSAVGATLFVLLLLTLFGEKDVRFSRPYTRLSVLTLALVMLWAITVVPVYKLLGIGTPKEESGGMMLNQMARVAACGGEMSEEEAAYMDSLVPLELYPEVYRPCCVDMLKWDSHFNYSALDGGSFLKYWVSMGLKNPRLYLESLALESYGFYSVNRPEINLNTANISYGVPFNTRAQLWESNGFTVRFTNLFGGERLRGVLQGDGRSVPVGLSLWFSLFVCVSLIRRGRGALVLALIPSLGLIAGLIVGTPIYYLPRYGAPSQLLVPLFLVLLFTATPRAAVQPSRDQ